MPADEAARLIARVLRDEAPYLSRRGRAALSEALALLEAGEPEPPPAEYTTIDDARYQRWQAQRRNRRER